MHCWETSSLLPLPLKSFTTPAKRGVGAKVKGTEGTKQWAKVDPSSDAFTQFLLQRFGTRCLYGRAGGGEGVVWLPAELSIVSLSLHPSPSFSLQTMPSAAQCTTGKTMFKCTYHYSSLEICKQGNTFDSLMIKVGAQKLNQSHKRSPILFRII